MQGLPASAHCPTKPEAQAVSYTAKLSKVSVQPASCKSTGSLLLVVPAHCCNLSFEGFLGKQLQLPSQIRRQWPGFGSFAVCTLAMLASTTSRRDIWLAECVSSAVLHLSSTAQVHCSWILCSEHKTVMQQPLTPPVELADSHHCVQMTRVIFVGSIYHVTL